MDGFDKTDLEDAIAGAFDWWREAGVDCDFSDQAQSWLTAQESTQDESIPRTEAPQQKVVSPAQTAPPSETPEIRIERAAMPADLAAFRNWWLAEPSLAEGPPSRRVPPRGSEGAKLMVIVPEPERDDNDTLLCGPQGRLLDAMLSAMSLDQHETYIASALPRHTPGADWGEIGASGLNEVLLRHVSLVAPQRLMILGTNVLSLTGHEPPQGPAVLRIFNHEGGSIPLLAARGLAALLEQPRWKAAIWRAWLDWPSVIARSGNDGLDRN